MVQMHLATGLRSFDWKDRFLTKVGFRYLRKEVRCQKEIYFFVEHRNNEDRITNKL